MSVSREDALLAHLAHGQHERQCRWRMHIEGGYGLPEPDCNCVPEQGDE